ncbi:hypothetical protein LZ554_006557 [Drepanopeziza brunnea f. sp. 'monogermtubi']|nr:hypothetical protein LZ554_006557 [Drepanopeziza brunnea f. sp. 'monogermtubi']
MTTPKNPKPGPKQQPSSHPHPSATPLQELTSISQLLHLTHHRNKNQHRLAKWYKPFSQLRRQVGRLLPELEALEVAERFSVSGNENGEAEGKYVRAARERVERRVCFLEEWIVEKCYLAFSNVIADQRYAVLGLFLMATLARVQAVVEQWSVGVGGDREGQEQGKQQEGQIERALEGAPGDELDLGEVVTRESVLEEAEAVAASEPREKRRAAHEAGLSDPSKPKKQKKKKKGGDAFDDMFAGLL